MLRDYLVYRVQKLFNAFSIISTLLLADSLENDILVLMKKNVNNDSPNKALSADNKVLMSYPRPCMKSWLMKNTLPSNSFRDTDL